MPTPYTSDAFAYRVNFAAAVISAGRQTTRSFDTCFEMYDGDAVAVALYRRSRRNLKLRASIWRYLSRKSVVSKAWEHRRKTRADLAAWAAELRRSSKEAFDKWMADRDAKDAAQREAARAAGYSVRQPVDHQWVYVSPDGTESENCYHESSAWAFAFDNMQQATAA